MSEPIDLLRKAWGELRANLAEGDFVSLTRLDAVEIALAAFQPAAEPVAWIWEHPSSGETKASKARLNDTARDNGWTETPLYAGPVKTYADGVEDAEKEPLPYPTPGQIAEARLLVSGLHRASPAVYHRNSVHLAEWCRKHFNDLLRA